MRQTFKVFVMLLLVCVGIPAQEADIYSRPERFERNRDYDVHHYRMEFRFDENSQTYWGKTNVIFSALKDDFQTCILDSEDFTVTSVSDPSGSPLVFEQTDRNLIVKLNKVLSYGGKAEFSVSYFEKNPTKGLRFIAESPDNPAQINTYAWPDRAHHWFPCYDFPNDKATNELIATVRSDYKVLSNGRLIDVTENLAERTKTFHWSQDLPHSTYLIMMAAGPYEVIKDSLEDLPVNYWVYPKDVPDAQRSFRKTPDMIAFYNRIFGFEFPWAKYDQICIAGSGGGMEDTSATTLGHGTIHDERADQDFSSEGLVAHELAHQWWGDTVTERTWSHVWLSESFATYSEYLFTRYDRGEEEGAVNLLEKKNSYLREAREDYIRPLVFNRYENPWDIMDGHSYPKGAVILHMLRFVLSDKPFFRTLKHFLHKHAFQVVDSHDFMVAVKEATGQNLDWFFEQWLFSPGHPEFEIRSRWDGSKGKLFLKVRQVQDTARGIPIFRLPVVIGIRTGISEMEQLVWIDKQEQTFEFITDGEPILVRFDKGNHLLKEWSFPKTAEELLFQFAHDDVIGRMWAASELISFGASSNVVEALKIGAMHDPFWHVRKNAVASLGKLKDPGLKAFFRDRCQDENSQVRTQALKSLGDYRDPNLADFFIERFEIEDSYVVQAQALRSLGECGEKRFLSFFRKAAEMDSPRRVIKRAAEAAMEMLQK